MSENRETPNWGPFNLGFVGSYESKDGQETSGSTPSNFATVESSKTEDGQETSNYNSPLDFGNFDSSNGETLNIETSSLDCPEMDEFTSLGEENAYLGELYESLLPLAAEIDVVDDNLFVTPTNSPSPQPLTQEVPPLSDNRQPVYVELEEGARMPECMTLGSAGYDLYCSRTTVLPAGGKTVMVPTGIKTSFPQDMSAVIFPRSGLSAAGVVARVGVVDSDYDKEWKVMMANHNSADYVIEAGHRTGQVVFIPIVHPQLVIDSRTPATGAHRSVSKKRHDSPYERPSSPSN